MLLRSPSKASTMHSMAANLFLLEPQQSAPRSQPLSLQILTSKDPTSFSMVTWVFTSSTLRSLQLLSNLLPWSTQRGPVHPIRYPSQFSIHATSSKSLEPQTLWYTWPEPMAMGHRQYINILRWRVWWLLPQSEVLAWMDFMENICQLGWALTLHIRAADSIR